MMKLQVALILSVLVCTLGCTGKKEVKTEEKPAAIAAAPVSVGNETSLLLKDLEANGDYVNSKEFPSLIKASLVFDNLDKKMLVIDLRPAADFKKGHIKKAVNKQFEDLPVYFESGIKPFEYDKIILVSEDGQQASYTTCLLRLMGYGNVYAMRWGMGGWNTQFAEEGWLRAVSGKYENKLEITDIPMPPAKGMPELKTGNKPGKKSEVYVLQSFSKRAPVRS